MNLVMSFHFLLLYQHISSKEIIRIGEGISVCLSIIFINDDETYSFVLLKCKTIIFGSNFTQYLELST